MRREQHIFLLVFILHAFACKDKYVAGITQPLTGYLVIEGFINSGTGPTVITLSRSLRLIDTISIRKEARAIVRVEGKSGTTAILSETFLGSGVYSGTPTIIAGELYRLSITTSAGRAYVSDYSEVRKTVDIDSINWVRTGDGVTLYANTHDPNSKTRYYRYGFDETWEFHSPYKSYLKFFYNSQGMVDHVGYRDSLAFTLDSSLYRCWKTASSTDILVASSEKLDVDRIAFFPIQFIEKNSWKLSVLYSVNVKQYSMSRDGYRFFEQLRKNTQQLGTIFDSQPSDNRGNIHCVNDASEPVLGFVEVSEEKMKRIFISTAVVQPWLFDRNCIRPDSTQNVPDSIKRYLMYIPTVPDLGSPAAPIPPIRRAFFQVPECVNCQLYGVNTKPSFWP